MISFEQYYVPCLFFLSFFRNWLSFLSLISLLHYLLQQFYTCKCRSVFYFWILAHDKLKFAHQQHFPDHEPYQHTFNIFSLRAPSNSTAHSFSHTRGTDLRIWFYIRWWTFLCSDLHLRWVWCSCDNESFLWDTFSVYGIARCLNLSSYLACQNPQSWNAWWRAKICIKCRVHLPSPFVVQLFYLLTLFYFQDCKRKTLYDKPDKH